MLPNSGIVIAASTLWWQRAPPWDDRLYRASDLPSNPTFADYARNIDPVVKAVEAAPR